MCGILVCISVCFGKHLKFQYTSILKLNNHLNCSKDREDEQVVQPVALLGNGWRPWEGYMERRERQVVMHGLQKSCFKNYL